jgi:hypothetical protein
MWHPPDPDMRRAAMQGSPNRKPDDRPLKPEQREYASEVVFATADTAAAAFRDAMTRKAVRQ